MIFFLIVVTVGGTVGDHGAVPRVAAARASPTSPASTTSPPAMGGFVIYVVLIVVLVLRPQGLFARLR
jgi:branched-chain amino acid transport system permease protein